LAQNEQKADPKIIFHAKCDNEKLVALPILDKIIQKTLCLHNYPLSQGLCQSLAFACKNLDSDKVNRVLFNNCNIDGTQFANILKSLS